MALFNLTRWPSVAIFALAGVAAIVLSFVTVNLFTQAASSLGFLQKFGVEAVRHGALWQVLELMVYGTLALLSWVLFKICEHELVDRYLHWARQKKGAPKEIRDAEKDAG